VNIIDDSKARDVVCFLKDIPFLKIIPQEDKTASQNPDLLCKTEETQAADCLDFSKYKVNSFLGCDPLKYQKSIRDEWK
jgi:hypothetical protein